MNSSQATDILIIGTGVVGEWLAEFFARHDDIRAIALADTNRRRGEAIAVRAAAGALQEGYAPHITFHELNVSQVDATASLIEKLAPRVIVHAATLLSVPVMAAKLPAHVFARLRAVGFGGFLPLHLYLSVRLMQAVKQMVSPPPVLNLPFPDFVNPVLQTVGLAPWAGCGNVNLIANLARLAIAQEKQVAASDVHVYFVASHSVNESFLRDGGPGKAPYYFRASIAGIDRTAEIDIEKLLADISGRMRGVPTESHTASSTVRAVRSLLRNDQVLLHAPGPNGLPGGYPIRFTPSGPEICLPPDLTLEEAVKMNQIGLQVGGIERIEAGGKVSFTETVSTCMGEEFGYEATSFQVSDVEEHATDLLERFRRKFV